MTTESCAGKPVTPGTDYSLTVPAVTVPVILFIGIIFLVVVLTLRHQYMRRRRGGTRDAELQLVLLSNRSACSEYTYPVSTEQVSSSHINQVSGIKNILADQDDNSGNNNCTPLASAFALRSREFTASNSIPLLLDEETYVEPQDYLGNEIFQPVDTSLEHLEDFGEELTAASDTASLKVHTQIFVHSQNHSSMELHNPLLKRVIVRSHSMDAIFQAVARINALDQAGIPYIFSDQYLERSEANGEQSTHCRWLHGNLQQVPRPENIDQYFMLPHYGDIQPGAVRNTGNHSGPSEHVQLSTRLHYQYQPYDHSQSPPYIGLDLFSGEQENITNPRHPYDAIELYERNNHPYSPRVDPLQYRGRRHSL